MANKFKGYTPLQSPPSQFSIYHQVVAAYLLRRFFDFAFGFHFKGLGSLA